jgi:hypothetical protein
MIVGLGGAVFLTLAAVWGDRRFIWPGLAAGGLVVTNALLHIGIALWRKEYNPGVGSAIVLFLPVAFLCFRFVVRHRGVGWQGVAWRDRAGAPYRERAV